MNHSCHSLFDSIEYINFQKFIRCIYTGHELLWADYRVKSTECTTLDSIEYIKLSKVYKVYLHRSWTTMSGLPVSKIDWVYYTHSPSLGMWHAEAMQNYNVATDHTHSVKTVTEKASFLKRSREWRFLITLASRLRVNGRKRMFSNTMMS